MNKFLIAAFTMALATPALAQGMASHDTMAAPAQSGMTNDSMKMGHKKPAKKTAMKHDTMGATGGMTGPAPSGGMTQGSMSGPGH